MIGIKAYTRTRDHNIMVRTYTSLDGRNYYEHALTPDEAISHASQLLSIALKAKYYADNPTTSVTYAPKDESN